MYICILYIINENSTVVPFLSPILPKLVGKIIMLNFVVPLYWYFFTMFVILTLIPILLLLEWLIELLIICNCLDCMNERNISNTSKTENAEENCQKLLIRMNIYS